MTQPTPEAIAGAQAAEAQWRIPASVTLAQWALESGWGAHMPLGSNNPFGIKAVPGQAMVLVSTREFEKEKWVTISAPFRKFSSLTQAFYAHAELLATRPQYEPARAALPSIEGFCNALTGVYATDPNYGHLLMQIINGSNLTQYDAPLAQSEAT